MNKQQRARRNLHPTPPAVFAMFHWHAEYAAQRRGSMDFFDGLTEREKRYASDAVASIQAAVEQHA